MTGPSDLAYRIAEIERRLGNVLRPGRISAVDAAAQRARVEIAPGVQTAWLPWMVTSASQKRHHVAPAVGEQVLILAVGGELNAGAILRGLWCDAIPSPEASPTREVEAYPDGTVAAVDWAASAVSLSTPGNISHAAGGDIAHHADGEAEIAGAARAALLSGEHIDVRVEDGDLIIRAAGPASRIVIDAHGAGFVIDGASGTIDTYSNGGQGHPAMPPEIPVGEGE